jgi:predicted phage tail protein
MIIRLPGALLRFANYQREIEYQAPTAEVAINNLVMQYPGLKSALLDRKGQVRASHSMFLNGDQIGRAGTDVAVGPDDYLEIVTAIAGG